MFQLQCDVGILGGIFLDQIHVHVAHVALVLAFLPDQLGDGLRSVIEVARGQQVHAMAHVRLQQVMGQHGVEEFAPHPYAMCSQDCQVILEVLADLADLLIIKNFFKVQ